MWNETYAYQVGHSGTLCRFRLLLVDCLVYIGRSPHPCDLTQISRHYMLKNVGRDNGPASVFRTSCGLTIVVPQTVRPLLERHLGDFAEPSTEFQSGRSEQ